MSRPAGEMRIGAWWERVLPQGKLSRSVMVLSGGTALGQAIAALSSPVLTRLYNATEFGQLSVYTAILSFLLVISSLRYEMAILLPEEDGAAANVLGLALLLVLPITLLTGLAVWLVPARGIFGLELEGLHPYLWVLPFSLLGAGFYQAFLYWALRRGAYRDVARTKVAQAAGLAGVQLGTGLLGAGTLGLLAGDAVGRSAGLLTLAGLAWRQGRTHFRTISWKTVVQAAARYRKFPLISSWSALVNTAGLQLPVLFLAAHFGSGVAGWYGLVDRIMAVPIGLIGQGASQVYMGEAARLANDDPRALRGLFWRCARRLALPALLLGGGAAAIGPYVFSIVFGAGWLEAGVYARLLAVSLATSFVAWPLNATLTLLERQDLQLYWDAGRLLLILVVFRLVTATEATPREAVLALGIAMAAGYAAHFWMGHAAITAAIRRADAGKNPPLPEY